VLIHVLVLHRLKDRKFSEFRPAQGRKKRGLSCAFQAAAPTAFHTNAWRLTIAHDGENLFVCCSILDAFTLNPSLPPVAFIPQQIGNLSGYLSVPSQELLYASGGSWTVEA
jgi:hypothetical protein